MLYDMFVLMAFPFKQNVRLFVSLSTPHWGVSWGVVVARRWEQELMVTMIAAFINALFCLWTGQSTTLNTR